MPPRSTAPTYLEFTTLTFIAGAPSGLRNIAGISNGTGSLPRSLRTLISQFVAGGLVEQHYAGEREGGPLNYYEITEAGRARLQPTLTVVSEYVATLNGAIPPDVAEIVPIEEITTSSLTRIAQLVYLCEMGGDQVQRSVMRIATGYTARDLDWLENAGWITRENPAFMTLTPAGWAAANTLRNELSRYLEMVAPYTNPSTYRYRPAAVGLSDPSDTGQNRNVRPLVQLRNLVWIATNCSRPEGHDPISDTTARSYVVQGFITLIRALPSGGSDTQSPIVGKRLMPRITPSGVARVRTLVAAMQIELSRISTGLSRYFMSVTSDASATSFGTAQQYATTLTRATATSVTIETMQQVSTLAALASDGRMSANRLSNSGAFGTPSGASNFLRTLLNAGWIQPAAGQESDIANINLQYELTNSGWQEIAVVAATLTPYVETGVIALTMFPPSSATEPGTNRPSGAGMA